MKTVTISLWIALLVASSINAQKTLKIPNTGFSCRGRSTGYYADVKTGCQIYHMCDGLGRQFSYACPNTTLFQQRMLVCDHWYMVNCSISEKDYSANLLIGQRDKPFVSEDEVHVRTPRPDILTVPYYQEFNYYGKAEIPSASGDNGGIDNSITNEINDDTPRFSVPTHWSTELTNSGNQYTTASPIRQEEQSAFTGRPIIVSGPSGTESGSNFETIVGPTGGDVIVNRNAPNIEVSTRAPSDFVSNPADAGIIFNPPSKLFEPPVFNVDESQGLFSKASTTARSISSFNNQFLSKGSDRPQETDASGEKQEYKPFIDFIKRFNPEEPPIDQTEQKTQETQRSINTPFEIQASSESNGFVSAQNSNSIPNEPAKVEGFPNQNVAPQTVPESNRNNFASEVQTNDIAKPALDLLPPKTEFSEFVSTTMGPPIYYEWKWAAPAFDLEPPNYSDKIENNQDANVQKEGRPDFALPRLTTPRTTSGVTPRSIQQPSSTETPDEYKLGSYFIPDYVFPLDKQHPGYEEDGALTSFQVRRSHSVEAQESNPHPNYGENAQCPQCHPSFVVPGTCKPCVMIRR